MTVAELITELEKIQDKTLIVYSTGDGEEVDSVKEDELEGERFVTL